MKTLFLTLIFAFSTIADTNEEKPEMEFLKKLGKEKVIKENKRIRVSTSKETRAPLKNASPENPDYQSKNVVNKVVVVDQHRKRQDDRISVTEVASDNPFILKLEFSSKNEMYQVQRLEYKFFKANESSSDLSNMQAVETYDYNAKKRVNLDLQPLAPGNYKAVLRLVTHKSNQKNKKVTHEFVFFAEVEFERLKVETAHLVVENYNHPNGNFRSIFRTADSYSDYGGEITKFTYNIILDGEQYDYLETPFTNIVWIFKAKGIFEIEVTAHDSYGDTDSQTFTLEVTNAAPVINLSITKNQEMSGWIDFDFGGTYDPDGVEVARYVIMLYLLENGVFRYKRAEFTKEEKFSFPLAGRGTTQVCSAALSSTGDYNIKCQTVDHFDNIAPIMRLYHHEYNSSNPSYQNFFTRCNDSDGETSQLKVRGVAPSGEVHEKSLSSWHSHFYTPEKGDWSFYFSCVDNDGARSNILELKKDIQYDLGQPKGYVELASISSNSSNLVWAPVVAQVEPSPYAHRITKYSYQAQNLGNGDTFEIDHSNPYDAITFPSYGKWKIEYTVKDNLWLVSEPQVFEVVVNSFPVASFSFSRPDYRTLLFTSQSTDEYGEIVKYSLKATSDAGEVIEKEFIENQFELSFGLGLWSIEIAAIDDLGDRSISPWKGGVIIKNINPVASFTYELNPEKFGKVKFNSKSTDVDGEISNYQLELVNLSTGAVQNHNFASASYEIVLEEADWSASIIATDNDGGVSEPWTTTFKIFNEPPVAHFAYNLDESSFGKVDFISHSTDVDGTIVKYFLKGTSDKGESVDLNFTSDQFSHTFTEGNWNINIIAIDDLGKKSEKWIATIEIVNPAPIAIFEFSKDQSVFGKMDFISKSTDANGTVEKYYLTGSSDKGDSVDLTFTTDQFSHTFTEGSWNIGIVAVDDMGKESVKWLANFNIVNQAPIAKFAYSKDPMNYNIVNFISSSSDSDGTIAEYQVHAYNGAGLSLNKTFTTNSFSLELEDGFWNLEIFAVDNLGKKSSYPWTTRINIENLNPVASFYFSQGSNWDIFDLNAAYSYDPDGYIVNYHYTFFHSSGATKELSTTQQLVSVQFDLEGYWQAELEVMDNFGNISNKNIQYINVFDPNQAPVASVSYEFTETFGLINFTSNSYDNDGEVKTIEVAGHNELGHIINENFSLDTFAINLGEGAWSLSFVAVDDKGKRSQPYSLYISIEKPEIWLSYDIIGTSDPYTYQVDASESWGEGILTFNIKVYFEGSLIQDQNYSDPIVDLNLFNKNGSYEVSVFATNGSFSTASVAQQLNISLPNIDGDTIPEDPGTLADATLLGVDSDQDGVRDDIELLINSRSDLTAAQKVAMKELSKKLQAQLMVYENKDESISATFDEIAYGYCIESRFEDDLGDQVSNELRVEYFNTRERLLAWAQGQVNFAGQAVVLDTNEAGYASYCE